MCHRKAFDICESEMAAAEDLELERQKLKDMDNRNEPQDYVDRNCWVTFEYYTLAVLLLR